MPDLPNPETRTLRRVALLTLRARQDERDRNIVERLGRIASVIEQMKRDIALRSSPSGRDVSSLAQLVRGLPKTTDRLRESAFGELRELVSELSHA